jgi:hypothetical protein
MSSSTYLDESTRARSIVFPFGDLGFLLLDMLRRREQWLRVTSRIARFPIS